MAQSERLLGSNNTLMNISLPILIGTALALGSPSASSIPHPRMSPLSSPQERESLDPQKVCESQAFWFAREVQSLLKTRLATTFHRSLNSVGIELTPDPKWPHQYVQKLVATYLDGSRSEESQWVIELQIPNPFTGFKFHIDTKGEYRLNVNCRE